MPKTAKREVVWKKCDGEAHSNFHIDHCMLCAPYWLWVPTCPDCGRMLKETTPAGTPEVNRYSYHRYWCRTCRKHVLHVPIPEVAHA